MRVFFNFIVIAVGLLLFACGQDVKNQNESSSEGVSDDSIQVELSQVWATDTIQLITPECASYDSERNVFYVSNLNRESAVGDDGYMSIVNVDGSIKNAKWVKGIAAPLGNGLFDGNLYVNDKTSVVKIDIESGKVIDRIPVEGSKRLNGIDIDKDGNVYSADIDGNKIFRITQAGEVTIAAEDAALDKPNGVRIKGNELIVASSNGGKLLSVDLGSKEIKTLAEGIERADGVVLLEGGHYLVSSWTGLVYFVSSDLKTRKILDTKDQGINAADITFIPKESTLVVPTFNDNRLVAYKMVIN